jgi:cytochrome b
MKVTLWFLRLVLLLHCVLVILQPVMAGYFLSGEADAMNWHSPIGSTLWMVTFLQILVAFGYWWPGRGRFWPVVATVALFFAEFLQMTLGHSQTMSVHVPLGTSIVVAVVLFTIWSFLPAAHRVRPRRIKEAVR